MNTFDSKPYSLGKDPSEKAKYTDNVLSLKGFGRNEPKIPKSARVTIPIANIKGRPKPSDSSRGFAGTAELATGFVKKNISFDKNDPKRPKRTLIEVPYVLPANKSAILRAVKKADGNSVSILEDKLLRPATDIDYLEVLKLLVKASEGEAKERFQDLLRVLKVLITRNKLYEKRGKPMSDEDQRHIASLKNEIDEIILSEGEELFRYFEDKFLRPEREKADEEAAAALEAEIEQKAQVDEANRAYAEERTRTRGKVVVDLIQPGRKEVARRQTTTNLLEDVKEDVKKDVKDEDTKTVNLETATVVDENAPGLDRDAIVELLNEFDKKPGEQGYLKNKELAEKMEKDFKELYDRLSATNRGLKTSRNKTKEDIIRIIGEEEERLQRRETAKAKASASASSVKQEGNGIKMRRGYTTHGVYSAGPIRPRLKL